jgi:UDP-N-acetylmuramoyl-tripeptide--D-alanyl-D-alanine ligase
MSASPPLSRPAIEQTFDGLRFTLNDRSEFRLPLLGRHNAVNAAAAVAVGRRVGLKDAQIAAGLASVRGAEMRLERTEVNGIRILNDAYNANPDSMRAALGTLDELGPAATRRVVVLGDMLELGEGAPALHAEMGDCLAGMRGLDLIVLVGSLMGNAADRLTRHNGARLLRLDAMDDGPAADVAGLLRPGDLVLLKGSRRMGLERLVAAVKSRHAPAAHRAAHAGAG